MNKLCLRAFYFTVVFWGKEYRGFFINLLLASLLSPNNIPALHNKNNSKFIIATTEEDWRAIQNEQLYLLLKNYIEVVYIRLEDPFEKTNKMHMMSLGHKMISEFLFQNKAIGVFVTPDLVLSDNSVASLQERILSGKKVVLCPAIRFEYHGCMQGFSDLGVMQPGTPLVINSRQLMKIALNNLHSETKTWLWDSPYYARNPVCSMWQLPGTTNYVLHGYSWAPLAVDYAAIQQHDTTTFDLSTLDQDYVYKNFALSNDIHVVTDSDEVALASFTDEKDLSIPLTPHPAYGAPGLRNILNKDNLRRFHFCPTHGMDPLKRQLVRMSILLHGENIQASWYKVIRKAKKLVASSIQHEGKGKEYLASLIYDLHSFYTRDLPIFIKQEIYNFLQSWKRFLYRKFFKYFMINRHFDFKKMRKICKMQWRMFFNSNSNCSNRTKAPLERYVENSFLNIMRKKIKQSIGRVTMNNIFIIFYFSLFLFIRKTKDILLKSVSKKTHESLSKNKD